MPTEYYLWKWADNPLSAQPDTVLHHLQSGDLPPAIEPFLVRHVYARLRQVVGQSDWSEIVVDPYAETPGSARYIRFRHPRGGSPRLAGQLLQAVWEAGLTVYDATEHRLIGLPKRNLVEYPGGRQFVDIDAADTPGLLHELSAQPGLSALACYDHRGNMFQVWAHASRYAVEWQVVPGLDFRLHRIWVAGRPNTQPRRARLGTVEAGLNLFARELLGIAEVHRLWLAFLHGETLPGSHAWRDVTRQLHDPGQPPRHGPRSSAAERHRHVCSGQN